MNTKQTRQRDWLEKVATAAEKLVRCKGRYHSEQNYRALAALFGTTVPELSPLESELVDYPETLPCPVLLEPGLRFGKGVTTRTMLGALQRRAEYYAELNAMTPEQRTEHDARIEEFKAMLPALVHDTTSDNPLIITLPALPVLGSGEEWYQGFAAGAGGMRDECKAVLIAAGIDVR